MPWQMTLVLLLTRMLIGWCLTCGIGESQPERSRQGRVDLLHLLVRQLPEALAESQLVDGIQVAAVDYTVLDQPGIARRDEDSDRQCRDSQVARNSGHDGQGTILVADVVLDDHTRVCGLHLRARGRIEIEPVDLTPQRP